MITSDTFNKFIRIYSSFRYLNLLLLFLLTTIVFGTTYSVINSKQVIAPTTEVKSAQTSVPIQGTYFGSWVGNGVNIAGDETTFETTLEKKRSIRHWYWSVDPVNTTAANFSTWAQGMDSNQTLMLSWCPSPNDSTLDNVNSGNHDAYIREWAQTLKNYQKEMFLRVMWEDNGSWFWWYSGSDSNSVQKNKYKSAFQRVVNIFREVGANNVKFVWSPNVSGNGVSTASLSYPGDSFVDWIGLDGYPYKSGKGDFSSTFKYDYDELGKLNKPLMIAETGISISVDSERANYITNLLVNQLPVNFPNFKAFVWFNEPPWGNLIDNKYPLTLNAFKSGISSSYYIGAQTSDTPTPTFSPTASTLPTNTITPSPISTNGNGILGNYYKDKTFTTLAFKRIDSNINFLWYGKAPDISIPSVNFSVRWTGFIVPQYSETYTFYTKTDDGVRLWVNNELLIDKWIPQSSVENSKTITLTAGVKYPITMEYYQGWGNSLVQLSWSSNSLLKQIVPQSQLYATDVSTSPTATNTPAPTSTTAPTPTPNITIAPTSTNIGGLTGSYYKDKGLTTLLVTRTDPMVNFNWGTNPDSSIPRYNFSVRWTGYVIPTYSQAYTFYTKTDDGVRLWVNNQLLIDKWKDQGAIEYSGIITLTEGVKYPITMEYYQGWGGSLAQLIWSSSSVQKQIIPQTNLLPN